MSFKLLIVDDEVELCSLLKEYFGGKGYLVEVSHDGVEAIEKVGSFQPDLILLDVRMPKMNGFNVLESIKKLSSNPVIMISGVIDLAVSKRCLEAGASSYISKPFSLAYLSLEIEKKLNTNVKNETQEVFLGQEKIF